LDKTSTATGDLSGRVDAAAGSDGQWNIGANASLLGKSGSITVGATSASAEGGASSNTAFTGSAILDKTSTAAGDFSGRVDAAAGSNGQWNIGANASLIGKYGSINADLMHTFPNRTTPSSTALAAEAFLHNYTTPLGDISGFMRATATTNGDFGVNAAFLLAGQNSLDGFKLGIEAAYLTGGSLTDGEESALGIFVDAQTKFVNFHAEGMYGASGDSVGLGFSTSGLNFPSGQISAFAEYKRKNYGGAVTERLNAGLRLNWWDDAATLTAGINYEKNQHVNANAEFLLKLRNGASLNFGGTAEDLNGRVSWGVNAGLSFRF
jgi:hypothetical protein